MSPNELTPEILLKAYAVGLFPMADSADDQHLYWYDPDPRGILPLDKFHIPKRLKKIIRQQPFQLTLDKAFHQVIAGCAEATTDRPRTWINQTIIDLYTGLHQRGLAHSIEAWEGNELVGGLYGVALGAAFFGESMFSRRPNASKICLCALAAQLWDDGYHLFDTQFVNPHLVQFGAIEIPRSQYHRRLENAIIVKLAFPSQLQDSALHHFMERATP